MTGAGCGRVAFSPMPEFQLLLGEAMQSIKAIVHFRRFRFPARHSDSLPVLLSTNRYKCYTPNYSIIMIRTGKYWYHYNSTMHIEIGAKIPCMSRTIQFNTHYLIQPAASTAVRRGTVESSVGGAH